MIAKGEKASINFLAWTLHEVLDLLRPAQEKCEALPKRCSALLGGGEQSSSGEALRHFSLPTVRVSQVPAFLEGGKKLDKRHLRAVVIFFPRNIWVVLAIIVLNVTAVSANNTSSHF